MKNFFRNNSLSIVFFSLFVLSFIGQVYCGFQEHNKELVDAGASAIALPSYLSTGHFIQATFENWESEFLQMALLVVLTIFLQQKGSSESKDFDQEDEVDREPSPNEQDAPWPSRAGGLIMSVYKYSLTIVLGLLFVFSFMLHFYGSLKDENELLRLKGKPL